MDPMEKQERIKFLWRKLRSSIRFLKFMGRVDPAAFTGVDLDELYLDHTKVSSTPAFRWYIVRTNNKCIQLWNLVINFLTIYALFATPLA